MVNKIHFGKRIAALRRKAGLSQTDLAEKPGVTSQAVSKWECGNAIPDIDLLLDLSHLHHVTINEMFEDIDLLCKLTGRETGYSGILFCVRTGTGLQCHMGGQSTKWEVDKAQLGAVRNDKSLYGRCWKTNGFL